MTSREKIDAFKNAMMETDEVFDGPLGLIQGAVGLHEAGMGPDVFDGLSDDPGEVDAVLLDVAGFCLWLRSDDAPVPDHDELAKRLPEAIAELVHRAGIA